MRQFWDALTQRKTMNITLMSCLRNKSIKSFGAQEKKKRWKRITLMNTPCRMNNSFRFTINNDGIWDWFNTKHQQRNPLIIEPHLPHYNLQKGSFYFVICFAHIKSENHKTFLNWFVILHTMKSFKSYQNIVRYVPILSKGTLMFCDNLRHNFFESIHQNLRKDFVQNIE